MPSVLEVEATPLPSGPDMMPDMVMPMGMGSINSLIASLASFVRPSCPKADALQSGSPVKRLLDEGHV